MAHVLAWWFQQFDPINEQAVTHSKIRCKFDSYEFLYGTFVYCSFLSFFCFYFYFHCWWDTANHWNYKTVSHNLCVDLMTEYDITIYHAHQRWLVGCNGGVFSTVASFNWKYTKQIVKWMKKDIVSIVHKWFNSVFHLILFFLCVCVSAIVKIYINVFV